MPAMTPALLKAELQNDPGIPAGTPVGYAPLIAAKNDAALLALINTPGTTAAYQILRSDVTSKEIISAIAPADFTALTAVLLAKLQLMFLMPLIDLTNPNTLANLQGIVSLASLPTKDAMTALSKRFGSPAEVRWGAGTAPTLSDISFALRGTP